MGKLIFFIACLLFSAILSLSACDQHNAASPPIELPFSLIDTDDEIVIPLVIDDPGGFRIAFKLYYEKNNSADRERLYQLFDAQQDDTRGLSVEISIEVSSIENGHRDLSSKTITRAELYASGDGYFSLRLDDIALSSGKYLIKIRNLKAVANIIPWASALHISSNLRK